MTMIELLRELKGEGSQQEFAALLGISQVHVSMLLSGKRAAGRQVADALMRAFPVRSLDIQAAFFAQDYNNTDDVITGDVAAVPEEEREWTE
jgi:transcriptional regulator with XRE-family HTH domain